MQIQFKWLGLVDYEQALKIQNELWQKAAVNGEAFVIGLEHPSVVTLGKRGDAEKDLMLHTKLPVLITDRGGQATLHSPGQLVIYPIVPLRNYRLSVRDFVGRLHQSTIQALAQLGITAHEICGQPGVFTSKGKIAFTGIRIDRGISRHGISINVSNDLSLFQNIRPCGWQNPQFDQVSCAAPGVNTENFFNIWRECFKLDGILKKSECSAESSLGAVGSAFP